MSVAESVTDCESMRVIDGVNLTDNISVEQHLHVADDVCEGIAATGNVTVNEIVPRCMDVAVSQSVNVCKSINIGDALNGAKTIAVTERDKELFDETIKTIRSKKCKKMQVSDTIDNCYITGN